MRKRAVPILVVSCAAILSGICRPTAARAEGQDFSGTYEDEGSTVYILTSPTELFVSYAEKFGSQSCACLARADVGSAGSYSFDASTDFVGTVELHNYGVIFKLPQKPPCCGSGWRGLPRFDAEDHDPPTACTVAAPQAHFYAYKRGQPPQRRPTYVMKDDKVVVVPTPGELSQQFWLARFVGPKKSTIGLLKKSDLNCPTQK